jgi:hypothetical protein
MAEGRLFHVIARKENKSGGRAEDKPTQSLEKSRWEEVIFSQENTRL